MEAASFFSWIGLFEVIDSSFHSSWFEKNQVMKKRYSGQPDPGF